MIMRKAREQYKADMKKDSFTEGELNQLMKKLNTSTKEMEGKEVKQKEMKQKEMKQVVVPLEEQHRARKVMKWLVTAAMVCIVVGIGLFIQTNHQGNGEQVGGEVFPSQDVSSTSVPITFPSQEPTSDDEPGTTTFHAVVIKKYSNTSISVLTLDTKSGVGKEEILSVGVLEGKMDDNIEEGDVVVINFNGVILESYPAQISAFYIKLAEKSQSEGIYPLLYHSQEYSYQKGSSKLTFQEACEKAYQSTDVIIVDNVIYKESWEHFSSFYQHAESGILAYLPLIYIDTKAQTIRSSQIIFDGSNCQVKEYSWGQEGQYNKSGEYENLMVKSIQGENYFFLTNSDDEGDDDLIAYTNGENLDKNFMVIGTSKNTMN